MDLPAHRKRLAVRRPLLLVSLLVAVALIVAACGGGGGVDPGTSSAGVQGGGAGNQSGQDGSGSPAESEPRTLRLAYYPNPTHPIAKEGIEAFARWVEEETGGQIKFEIYPSEQLGKAADSIRILQTGVADLVFIAMSYHANELPLSQVVYLPWGWDSWTATNVFWRALHEEGPIKDEWDRAGLYAIFSVTNPPYEFNSVSKPITGVDDLRGLKVRSFGDVGDQILAAVGATSVQMPTPEIYESLQRGTIDATVYAFGSWGQYNLQEILKHTTKGTNVQVIPGLAVITTRKLMDSLTPEQQEIFSQLGHRALLAAQEANLRADQEAFEQYVAGGLTVHEWSEEERQRLKELIAPVMDNWAQAAQAAGIDGPAAISQIQTLIDEVTDPMDIPYYEYRP